jgi:hypothetical protein
LCVTVYLTGKIKKSMIDGSKLLGERATIAKGDHILVTQMFSGRNQQIQFVFGLHQGVYDLDKSPH